MGASSSAPRSYSVEPDDPKTDAMMDVVGVTEDVMKRIMGYERDIRQRPQIPPPAMAPTPVVPPKATPPSVPTPSHHDRALEDQLRKLREVIEHSEEDFLQTYSSLRHRLVTDEKLPCRNDACQHLADNVVSCYTENKANPLKCRSYVVAFRECVLTSFTKAQQPK
ncbi:hypothetical protein DMENIID0001_166810 [Sergentomyia squamirostris]